MLYPIPIRIKRRQHYFVGIVKASDWFKENKVFNMPVYGDFYIVCQWIDYTPDSPRSRRNDIEGRQTIAMVRDEEIAHLIYREFNP